MSQGHDPREWCPLKIELVFKLSIKRRNRQAAGHDLRLLDLIATAGGLSPKNPSQAYKNMRQQLQDAAQGKDAPMDGVEWMQRLRQERMKSRHGN
jgi:protein involved in polysaccharide export with SLBB domain